MSRGIIRHKTEIGEIETGRDAAADQGELAGRFGGLVVVGFDDGDVIVVTCAVADQGVDDGFTINGRDQPEWIAGVEVPDLGVTDFVKATHLTALEKKIDVRQRTAVLAVHGRDDRLISAIDFAIPAAFGMRLKLVVLDEGVGSHDSAASFRPQP